MQDGVIKYTCQWQKMDVVKAASIVRLNNMRERLFAAGLIGVYPDGIGYGNISERESNETFIISGSATGGLPVLSPQHYARVTAYNMQTHTLSCEGMIQASSESLTHAAIYACDMECKAVIHVHSAALFNQLLHRVPTASADVAYGTPEMVQEVYRLFAETDVASRKLFVMAGHQDGVMAFGRSLEEAMESLTSKL